MKKYGLGLLLSLGIVFSPALVAKVKEKENIKLSRAYAKKLLQDPTLDIEYRKMKQNAVAYTRLFGITDKTIYLGYLRASNEWKELVEDVKFVTLEDVLQEELTVLKEMEEGNKESHNKFMAIKKMKAQFDAVLCHEYGHSKEKFLFALRHLANAKLLIVSADAVKAVSQLLTDIGVFAPTACILSSLRQSVDSSINFVINFILMRQLSQIGEFCADLNIPQDQEKLEGAIAFFENLAFIEKKDATKKLDAFEEYAKTNPIQAFCQKWYYKISKSILFSSHPSTDLRIAFCKKRLEYVKKQPLDTN